MSQNRWGQMSQNRWVQKSQNRWGQMSQNRWGQMSEGQVYYHLVYDYNGNVFFATIGEETKTEAGRICNKS